MSWSWSSFVAYMHEIHWVSIAVRLALATLVGGILGINRARRHRPAGFRTHMLVCLGASIVMITNQYLTALSGGGDPARLGAQVISGIGFLGAGTIVVNRRNQVLGLTTAAGLWACACIGLAIGAGFYGGAVIGAGFLFIIVIVFDDFDQWLQNGSRRVQIYMEFETPANLSKVLSYASQNGVEAKDLEIIEARNPSDHLAAIVILILPKRSMREDLIVHLRELEGVIYLMDL